MRLKSKECIIGGQTRPYEIRPNKTNFGLTFWAFLARPIQEGQERRREEVEEEEEEEEEEWITMYL